MADKHICLPNIYLGIKVSKVELENSVSAWSFSSSRYVQSSVQDDKIHLRSIKQSLSKHYSVPFTTGHKPAIDISATLRAIYSAYYQSLIGVLRWLFELGRIVIYFEVCIVAYMIKCL